MVKSVKFAIRQLAALAVLTSALAGCTAPDTSVPDDANAIIFSTHMGEHPGWIPAYEAIIRRYEQVHPGVKIKLHYQPLEGIDIWLETQFISGRGPDIVNSGNLYRLGARLGMLVPITEYLDEETPYVPGRRWRDTFYPVVWVNQEDAIYGEFWVVPFNFFTLRVFYNKELFAKAGIERPPKTWAEFMRIQQQLLDAGIVPYLMPNSLTTEYAGTGMNMLSEMLYQDRVPDLDTVNPDGQVDGLESNIGIYTGKIRLDDPQMLVMLRLLKEWSRYWVRGFNGLDRQQAKMMFANGIGAMYMDGSWETEGIIKAVTFEWGVFSFPTVTKETTPYADGPRNDNNFNLWFAVSKVAERRGHLPRVIDFLQFLTGPEAADTLTNYVSFISALRDYPVPDHLKPFAPDTGHPWSCYPWYVMSQSGSAEASDRLVSLLQGYFADEIDERGLVERYQSIYHSMTVQELRYALEENRNRVEETERRIAVARAKLDSLRASGGEAVVDSARSEQVHLERQLAWQETSLEKARRQYRAVRETLSHPPAWERQDADVRAGPHARENALP